MTDGLYLCKSCYPIYDWTQDSQSMVGCALAYSMAAWPLGGENRKGKNPKGGSVTNPTVSMNVNHACGKVERCCD